MQNTFSYSLGPYPISNDNNGNNDLLVIHVRFEAGFNNSPYLSIAAIEYGPESQYGAKPILFNGKRYWPHSAGCLHNRILKVFPDFSHYLRWHLTSQEGPMHYEANGIFWAEMAFGFHERKLYDPDPMEAFKETVVFGAVKNDDIRWLEYYRDHGHLTKQELNDKVRKWLRNRFSALMFQFNSDLASLEDWCKNQAEVTEKGDKNE